LNHTTKQQQKKKKHAKIEVEAGDKWIKEIKKKIKKTAPQTPCAILIVLLFECGQMPLPFGP
jgi:hypothetical protein